MGPAQGAHGAFAPPIRLRAGDAAPGAGVRARRPRPGRCSITATPYTPRCSRFWRSYTCRLESQQKGRLAAAAVELHARFFGEARNPIRAAAAKLAA
jgi:hypothetical protein